MTYQKTSFCFEKKLNEIGVFFAAETMFSQGAKKIDSGVSIFDSGET